MMDTIDESLQRGIQLASVEVPEIAPVVSEIKKLSYNDVTWDRVAEGLI